MNTQHIHIQFLPQSFSFQKQCTSFTVVKRPSWFNSCSTGGGIVRCSVNEIEEQKQKQQVVKRAYPFHEIEPKWQSYWENNRTFRTPDEIDTSKPKFYVLDMFPYPRSLSFSSLLLYLLKNEYSQLRLLKWQFPFMVAFLYHANAVTDEFLLLYYYILSMLKY